MGKIAAGNQWLCARDASREVMRSRQERRRERAYTKWAKPGNAGSVVSGDRLKPANARARLLEPCRLFSCTQVQLAVWEVRRLDAICSQGLACSPQADALRPSANARS